MSKYVILLHGLVQDMPSEYDDSYLKSFDFADCELGECNLVTVASPDEALQFDDTIAAWEFWKQVDPRQPLRLDGRPNRPLTAFSISVEPAS